MCKRVLQLLLLLSLTQPMATCQTEHAEAPNLYSQDSTWRKTWAEGTAAMKSGGRAKALEVLKLTTDQIESCVKQSGRSDLDIARSGAWAPYADYAELLVQQKRFSEANQVYKRLFRIAGNCLSARIHSDGRFPFTEHCGHIEEEATIGLARTFAALSDFKQSQYYYQVIIEMHEKKLWTDTPRVVICIKEYAELLRHEGKTLEASKMEERSNNLHDCDKNN